MLMSEVDMAKKQYTEKQLKIISGEIPLDSIDGRDATRLYKKAIENGDEELAEKALQRKETAQDEARKRNIERTARNKALRRKGIFQWKQPKTNKYTERHKQIIRGEVALDQVHTNELIAIYQKARNNEDFALSEMLYEQIVHRREKERIRDKVGKAKYRERQRIIGDFEDYNDKSPITALGQAILNGVLPIDDCSETEIVNLIASLERLGDEYNLRVAKQLLLYKQDISVLYPTLDHWKAIDKIENLLQLPIRRPKDWF